MWIYMCYSDTLTKEWKGASGFLHVFFIFSGFTIWLNNISIKFWEVSYWSGLPSCGQASSSSFSSLRLRFTPPRPRPRASFPPLPRPRPRRPPLPPRGPPGPPPSSPPLLPLSSPPHCLRLRHYRHLHLRPSEI
jgi:hypothetical protein